MFQKLFLTRNKPNRNDMSKKRLQESHDELWHTPQGKSIREVVFGMNDGLVTMIGFIAGLFGASQSNEFILIGGLAEMIAGTISMGLGAYLSTRSQIEFYQKEIDRERIEIQTVPEHERKEVEEFYRDYGFSEEETQIITRRITSSKDLWLKFMIREELGLVEEKFDNPLQNGLVTGVAYLIGSIPTLIPYVLNFSSFTSFWVAMALSAISLFGLGIGISRFTKKSIFQSGMNVLFLGIVASIGGYLIGYLFHLLVL